MTRAAAGRKGSNSNKFDFPKVKMGVEPAIRAQIYRVTHLKMANVQLPGRSELPSMRRHKKTVAGLPESIFDWNKDRAARDSEVF